MKLTLLCFLVIFTQTGWSQVDEIIKDINKSFTVSEVQNKLEMDCLNSYKQDPRTFKANATKACLHSINKATNLGLDPMSILGQTSKLERIEEDFSF